MVRVPTDGKRTVQGELSNSDLSQTEQILNLGIQYCLWFVLRIGVYPVRSFDVPGVRLRCVPRSKIGAPSLKFRCVPHLRYQCVRSFRFRCFRFLVPLRLQFEV